MAGSRLAWSMARDRAFPYSAYFAKVNKTFGIPLRAMLAIVVIDLIIGQRLDNLPRNSSTDTKLILGLIVLGSDLAFESIISGGGVTLQIGYVTPVIVVCPSGAFSPFILRSHVDFIYRCFAVEGKFFHHAQTSILESGDIPLTSSACVGVW